MATPETRYEFLVKEHKRLHDMVSYLESDSSSSKIKADIKKKKLIVKDELTKLKAELRIPDEA